ncbi:MAG: response regulator transcription factor [Bryobacteraceae bacterium]
MDHNPLMREGLALLVRLQADMQLVGAVATAEETIRLSLAEMPDVILMDLDLPAQGAMAAVRRIHACDPRARIIGLATYGPDKAWVEAIAAGVCECTVKEGLSDSLPPLIRAASPGLAD